MIRRSARPFDASVLAAADGCIVLVATPHYLKERGTPKHPRDLSNHNLLMVKFLSGAMTPWLLIALVLAGGVGAALAAPAWQSSVPEMVPRADLSAAVALKAGRDVGEGSGLVASFAERQRLVRKPLFDALEKTYAE